VTKLHPEDNCYNPVTGKPIEINSWTVIPKKIRQGDCIPFNCRWRSTGINCYIMPAKIELLSVIY